MTLWHQSEVAQIHLNHFQTQSPKYMLARSVSAKPQMSSKWTFVSFSLFRLNFLFPKTLCCSFDPLWDNWFYCHKCCFVLETLDGPPQPARLGSHGGSRHSPNAKRIFASLVAWSSVKFTIVFYILERPTKPELKSLKSTRKYIYDPISNAYVVSLMLISIL